MNDKYKPLNVVAVFAHPDDEAGAVGTLMNHSDRGDNVYVVMLTHGENASSLKGSHDEIKLTRQGHVNQIEKIIGAQYRLMDLPDSGVFPSVMLKSNPSIEINFIPMLRTSKLFPPTIFS